MLSFKEKRKFIDKVRIKSMGTDQVKELDDALSVVFRIQTNRKLSKKEEAFVMEYIK